MSSYLSIKNKLLPLGLYNFDNTIVSAELQSYAAAIDILNDTIEKMLDENFITTACSYGIEEREKTVGAPRNDLTLTTRRKMLLKRQSIGYSDFTLQKFTEAFKSLDFECDITEMPLTYEILIEARGRTYTQTERVWIKSQVESLLPAHVKAHIYFSGYSWSKWESLNKTFTQLDSLGYTWDEIGDIEQKG